MFRNFDNRDRYYDLDGKVLHGCVQVMLKDGTTVAPIYDGDEVALANPQITDILGRTQHQVFVDSDVIAYFYKYVGEGTLSDEEAQGIDTSDQSKWSLQYTVENFMVDHLAVDGQSAMGVATMDHLRALDPYLVPLVDGIRIVCLHGYYEAGDKEPVWYVWEDESEQPDDNGAVIKSDDSLTGRWVLVQPTEHCDSRHFGVMPQDSASAAVDHSVSISQLFDYCNRKSIKPYFNGSETNPYFIYDQLTVVSRVGIDISDRTVFVDKRTSQLFGDINVDGSFSFLNGNTSIRSKKAYASWNAAGMSGYEYVVLDAATPQTQFSNATVKVTVPTGNKSFTNCTIDAMGTLGSGNSFDGCLLTGQMFDGVQSVASVTNCTFDIDDFTNNIQQWQHIAFVAGIVNYDYRNHVIPEDSSVLSVAVLSDTVVSNFIGNGVNTFPESSIVHTYTFNGCRGTLKFQYNADGNTYIFDNFIGTIAAPTQNKGYGQTFVFNNSSVTFEADDLTGTTILARSSEVTVSGTYKEVSLRDSTLWSGDRLTVDSFTSYNSILMASVTSKQSVVKDSQVNAKFTQSVRTLDSQITVLSVYDGGLSVTTSSIIDGFFDNNIFNAQLELYSNASPTLVRGLVITNNLSSVNNPVIINGRNSQIHPADDLHQYVYRNNAGTMETITDIQITEFAQPGNPPWSYGSIAPYCGVPGKAISSPIIRNSDMGGVFATSLLYIDSQSQPLYDRTKYFAEVKLFTIGTTNVHTSVEIDVEDPAEYLASNSDDDLDKISAHLSSGDVILCSPRSQGYTFSYTEAYISYPYNIEWDATTSAWRIKNIQIGLGSETSTPTDIRIRQK